MSNAKANIKSQLKTEKNLYSKFKRINGDHPLKQSVPNIYVGYSAFRRVGGEVAYFNFELAKEMGLIPQQHPHKMNVALSKQILETFAIQIINEYDILNKTKIDPNAICDQQYMATRYLQLQHPNKQGKTSGDGRSIWNGHFKGRNGHWDISSCGTGATRLSPASAIEKTFFKTGGKNLSYGCGKADFSEGLISAIFSDILYKNGLQSERTLAVIRFKNGTAVNVRANKNLLRPAHFFGYAKRSDYNSLKQLVDYYIQRQLENKEAVDENNKYQGFLTQVAKDFAKSTARFESDYIFCWMDWDGDNILMDGGIIDYGTIRQFGLFHHEYRYDDVDKMSTNIIEQKKKARHTIQVFAQIIDFLKSGRKKALKSFSNHESLTLFDEYFEKSLLTNFLQKIGYTKQQQEQLVNDEKSYETLRKFHTKFRFFEKAVAKRKAYKVADGITRDAIFCMRDFLREFPKQLSDENEFYTAKEFVTLVASNYSSQLDRVAYTKKVNQIESMQSFYVEIMGHCHHLTGISKNKLLLQLSERSAIINPHAKLTGNAVINIAHKILQKRSQLSFSEMNTLIHNIVHEHIYDPDYKDKYADVVYRKSTKITSILNWSVKAICDHRVGI